MTDKDKKRLGEILHSFLPIIIFALVIGILALIFSPEISRITTEEGRAEFKAFVDGIGFWGWLVTFGIQLLQIFVAFIPGEPVEIMLGFVWGPWLGMLTCLLGTAVSSLIIFFAVRRFGMRFIRRAVSEEDLSRFSFLSDERRIYVTLFILFFIPGTPKDVISYIAPLAPVRALPYLLITTVARIPSVVTSTILGDSVASGDYLAAVIVFVITALISLVGIILGTRYARRKSEKNADGSTRISTED